MRRMVEKILNCYGREVTVTANGETAAVFAFLQPVTGRGENMGKHSVSPLGTEHSGRYVFIGPVEPKLGVDDEVAADGRTFILRRVEIMDGMNGPAYQWAMCVEKGAQDDWSG